LAAGAVILAAVQRGPTDLAVTGVARAEEAVTAVEEVAPQVSQRPTTPHTATLLRVPMIKATYKANTTHMVVLHPKILTIRITLLLALILPFRNSPAPTRIIQPTKVRFEAMLRFLSVALVRSLLSQRKTTFRKESFFSFSSVKSTDPQDFL
jgi:hypothetical protein